MQTLLDHGASLGQSIVSSCLANGRPRAAEFLAKRGARVGLKEAAGLGRLDIVQKMCGGGRPRPPAAEGGRRHTNEELQEAFRFACAGHLDTVKFMLQHHPPLEAPNIYGGTVLGQALWSAAHGGDADRYIAILEELVAAGAKIPERHVPVNAKVDAWLTEHGSVAEPSWYWYGEKPLG